MEDHLVNKVLGGIEESLHIGIIALDLDPENSPPQWSKEEANKKLTEALVQLKTLRSVSGMPLQNTVLETNISHYYVENYVGGELTGQCRECGLGLEDEIHMKYAR